MLRIASNLVEINITSLEQIKMDAISLVLSIERNVC